MSESVGDASALPKRTAKKRSGKKRGGTSIEERPILFQAIESFIRENSCFESSVPVDLALAEIGKTAKLQIAFLAPITHRVFSMDTALHWLMFMNTAPARSAKEGEPGFTGTCTFSALHALRLIGQVYDLGVQIHVWDHFDEDDGADEAGDGDADAGAAPEGDDDCCDPSDAV